MTVIVDASAGNRRQVTRWILWLWAWPAIALANGHGGGGGGGGGGGTGCGGSPATPPPCHVDCLQGPTQELLCDGGVLQRDDAGLVTGGPDGGVPETCFFSSDGGCFEVCPSAPASSGGGCCAVVAAGPIIWLSVLHARRRRRSRVTPRGGAS